MKKYEHLRRKALELRKNGKTIGDICEMLSVGKGTAYYWIKDIPIPRTEKQTDAQKAGTKAMQLKCSSLREKAYEEGIKQYKSLMAKPLFRDFVVLYLTEGFRRTRHHVAVSNSNPNLIRLAYLWIRSLANYKRKFDFQIQCHVDNDENELKLFWSNVLGISKEQIKIRRKSNSGKLSGRQWRSEHGVFTVRVNDTYLRSRIESWMDKIQEEWDMSLTECSSAR